MAKSGGTRTAMLCCGVGLVAACSEPPPRSLAELLENPIVLEAVMVRCNQNRDQTRYDAECVNARQAVSILEAREDRARAEAFESESQRKREALRRMRQEEAEARRRAEEEARLREEAEYLAQFGEPPPAPENGEAGGEAAANAPTAVLPEPEPAQEGGADIEQTLPASDGANAPTNFDAIRDDHSNQNDESGD